jgi:hypothetical protein
MMVLLSTVRSNDALTYLGGGMGKLGVTAWKAAAAAAAAAWFGSVRDDQIS